MLYTIYILKISDFQYDQYNPDSKIEVDVKLHNGTGKKLVGLHVHDGKRIENERSYAEIEEMMIKTNANCSYVP